MRFQSVTFVVVAVVLPLMLGMLPKGSPQGKVVLRLPYRGTAPHKSPYTIGFWPAEECSGDMYVGQFMGTDWDGCIYIFDPIDRAKWMLKRFDRKGRFQEEWEPIKERLDSGEGVAVTKDGYIWTGFFVRGTKDDDIPGLPVLVYRKGIKRPVIDWRYSVPEEVRDRISKALAENGLEWRTENIWFHIRRPCAGPQQVALTLSYDYWDNYGKEETGPAFLWILLSSDGKKVIDLKISKRANLYPYLSPDGKVWLKERDREGWPTEWSKIYFLEGRRKAR